MKIKLTDMDKVEGFSGMLPTGRHTVAIANAEAGLSSGGYDQLEVEFESVEGLGTIRDWIVFSPSKDPAVPSFGKRKLKSLLDAVKIQPEGSDWEFDPAMLLDKRLDIVVGLEPDHRNPAQKRRRVQRYLEPSAGGDGSAGGGADDDYPF